VAGRSGDYYPVSLDVAGRSCLVVGGGPVAARKAAGLMACGALVTVVATDIGEEMADLSPALVERRPYATGEAALYRLVVTATGVTAVDAAVAADAEAAGVWVNSADDAANSSFILPSVHRDGRVSIAVSTGGASPALASWLRARLAAGAGVGVGVGVGAGLGQLADLLAEARARLHDAGISTETVDWRALLDGPLPALVREGRLADARSVVAEAIGLPF
jgi:precorrin-2 dehydrogenase / sirohydrochlorin ferrochelatase